MNGAVSEAELLLARPDLAWMGQNTTHLEPPAEVLEALEGSHRAREFQLYAPAMGLSELRGLILDDLGLRDAATWVTEGAVAGLHQVCTVFARTHSLLITSDPGWPWPGRFVGGSGVPVVALDVYENSDRKLTAAQIEGVIQDRSIVYLIDPLNPLGSRYTREELQAIVDLARAHDSLIVHDCTYRHFASGHSLVAELYPEGTITTYSFSKWLGLAGLRLGAVVANDDLLDQLTRVPSNPLGAPLPAQRAAIAGLRVRERWLGELRAVTRANNARVEQIVAETGLGEVVVPGSHGNFLAVDITASGLHAEEICARLLTRDVFIRPGTYQSPNFGERFVKVSTSVPPTWIERFGDAWADLAAER